jgi:bifunctional DNA-binding transcriptional regulator/antitoxin component of YhaV-PrlF toxin-antitoxin module
MSSSIVCRIDEKGRLIVPAAYREILNMPENSHVLITLNAGSQTLTVLPFASAGERLCRITVGLSDAPGSLSRLLLLLAKNGVDLVQSESIASERGKHAQWKAVADFSGCKAGLGAVKALLLREKVASSAEISEI